MGKDEKINLGVNKLEISFIYILSQIFVIINYAFLMISYQLKNRKSILIVNLISIIATGISFALLGGYSGVGMSLISILRNLIFMIDERKNGIRSTINKSDIIILIFIYLLSLICSFWTYNGIWSLMSVFASVVYTYSIWQKSTKVYKILGIPVCIFSLIYNIYLKSILGIILETILTISAIVGFIREGIVIKKVSQRVDDKRAIKIS